VFTVDITCTSSHEDQPNASFFILLFPGIALSLYQMDKDVLTKELSKMFSPEEMILFGSNSVLDWANFNAQAFSDESFSFDEVGFLC
jgi:hypothetical protein